MIARPLAVLMLATSAATTASTAYAQEWRMMESSRQMHGTQATDVRVEYGAGSINLTPTSDQVLYRMKLRYDADHTVPVASYDDASHAVTIGTHSGKGSWHGHGKDGNTLRAELTRSAPLRLTLELGATKGDIQLGGLRLADLAVKAGASETRIDFDSPNAEPLGSVDIDVGAADVSVRRGGNARAQRVHMNVGVGALDYDMAGNWNGDVDISANVALGSATLRIPADAGVRVTATTFLADFSSAGLEKHGNTWETPGFDAARRKVRVTLSATLGGFEIVRR